jgi:hypothetical protein
MRDADREEWLLSQFLITQVCGRAAGRWEVECLRNYPRDVYFIGSLRPSEDPQDNAPGYLDELRTKMAPVAFGAEFRVRLDGERVEIRIEVDWSCYYRIFPTLAQQLEHQRNLGPDNDGNAPAPSGGAEEPSEDAVQEGEETGAPIPEAEPPTPESPSASAEAAQDRRSGRVPRDHLFIRYRKMACRAEGVIVLTTSADGEWQADISGLQDALDAEARRAERVVSQDPERLRTPGSADAQISVPQNALDSEQSYREFIDRMDTEVVPKWQWETACELRSSDSDPAEFNVFVGLTNTAPRQAPAGGRRDNPNIEAFLFDVQARLLFDPGAVRPFELELAPRSFRYDRCLWGKGFNCAVDWYDEQPVRFETTHTPLHLQMRYATRTTPPARFDALASDPVPVLESILQAMLDYQTVWDQERQQYASEPGWLAGFGTEFDRDRDSFDDEIVRFRRGLDLIRNDPEVRLAFRLTNETFRRMGTHPRPEKCKETWRLFQIVFLVSQLPSCVALRDPASPDAAEREMVDIVYFPTGGGKTEAYLGAITFHCFFDRLCGKTAGVTAWTRFPLRLLTLQQTQRVADVIAVAELVRRERKDPRLSGTHVDGFAVGYFVGEGGSPNEITNPKGGGGRGNQDVTWSMANDPQARQNWKRIVQCPSCRTPTVEVDFVPARARLIHRCSNPNCLFPAGELPVFVVDNEIYRYLPCVIVGTIDKLAGIGNQRKMAQLFGKVDGRCAEHGYYKGKCCQKDCKISARLRPGVPPGLSGPTLFVQDELHLLKEGLGTFDAHYETFVQRLRREFGQTDPLKIIASTATIEAFDRQVAHLYGRQALQARIFPNPGPTLGQSFYAETLDYPQRLFVGIVPHNKTLFNAILELLEYYHRELICLGSLATGVANPYGGRYVPGSPEWRQLLDLYTTSLTYFLATRDLNSIRTDIEGDVNQNLRRDGLPTLNIHELTGNTSTQDVTRALEHLERPGTSGAAPDAVLATGMISHGVDLDRFNAMFFYGMPRQTAEYIQASSRAGRLHAGIIFTCLAPIRERDQSHYSYFCKFHEFLGQLVEPVAINRWAKFSVRRTLPGLFMAVLLQIMANRGPGNLDRYYILDVVRKEISDGNLRASDFIPILRDAYMVAAPATPGEKSFYDEIDLRVQQYLDWILGAGSGTTFVSEALIPSPMRSLRDVDETIEIELDSVGTQWGARNRR